MKNFVHLHLHTQYSILDGAANIERVFAKAQQLEMPAIAITDHGNMYGVLDFFLKSKKTNVKPILGCEIYVAKRSMDKKESDIDRSGFHLILLAKNLTGYHNLLKLVSKASIDGFYYTPRIDKDLLTNYHEGLIASSACLGGEIPYYIRQNNIDKARQAVNFYKDLFGDDFYLELQNHGLEDQAKVNPILKELANEFGIKTIVTNDVHFVNKEDQEAHNLLIRLNTNRDDSTLIYSGKEYLKSYDEMLQCFPDDEESILNTLEIAEKVESYSIENTIILPKFTLPENFKDDFDYLSFLTYKGAKNKYGNPLPAEVNERIEYELGVIKKMGFAGYFLIVVDYIKAAKQMGVLVGPGRGSAPGSIVSYCIGITNVEPLRYKLLFERFLNPERISMPDIDVDFDDAGRQSVLNYVIEKYGNERVAQIVSFQTMQARMAVRDVCRVKGIPLSKADKIAKLIPARPGTKLNNALEESPEFKQLYDEDPEAKQVINIAMTLEGNVRSTGVHACGVIISPSDITDFVPLAQAKDSTIPVVQYEGKDIEKAGMLKMDFLGLKTLSIIKDTLELIYKRKKIKIDIDNIPLDDKKTFELFQNGATVAVFQFESPGMQKYLKDLKPTVLDDLVAMNALYRPGPMGYIPTYIKRKNGSEPIKYHHKIMAEVLEDTYGIMIFQEQIMQLSEKMAGFSKAEADTLRKAMGKKLHELIEQMKVKFIDGCVKNNISKEIAEKVYEDMAQFGNYGFNRSHSVAYSIISYQTGYLKANYTAEFMASVLTHTSLKELNKMLSECDRLGIKVLGPDINESNTNFTVINDKTIRFGLNSIKNVGNIGAEAIIKERDDNGPFKNITDFASRIGTRSINKRVVEALAQAGAFDSLQLKRAQFFYVYDNNENTVDRLLRFANDYQSSHNATASLFGDEEIASEFPMPDCQEWDYKTLIEKEHEALDFYLSGHPLDPIKHLLTYFTTNKLIDINKTTEDGKQIFFGGLVQSLQVKNDKNNNPFLIAEISDYNSNYSLRFFRNDFSYAQSLLKLDNPYFFLGKWQINKNSNQAFLSISSIYTIEDIQKAFKKAKIIISLLDPNDEDWIKLIELIENNEGKNSLFFNINSNGKNLCLKLGKSVDYQIINELENIKCITSIKIYNEFIKDYIETIINIDTDTEEIIDNEVYALEDETMMEM